MAMSGQATRQSIWPKAAATQPTRPVTTTPFKAAFQSQHGQVMKLPQLRFLRNKIKPMQLVALSSKSESNNSIDSFFPSYIIRQFYSAINEKNLDRLEALISDDCVFDDYSFPAPFRGKKETMHFLEQLITSMGQNIEFHVEHIWEGDSYTSGVNWHLEWKNKQVPFTRGNSFFELTARGEKLLIKKARVVIESPIKPGGLALALFAIVTSLFDTFPEAAEWFLKSPEVIFQLLQKVYNMFVRPIIGPLLAWYIKLWSFTAHFLSITFKILQFLAKIFHT